MVSSKLTTAAAIQKRKLPLWATLVICLVVLSIVTISTSVFSLFMFARRVAVNATIPEKIESTAQLIAKFPKPLPQGYKNLMAADFALLQFLVVEHEPTHQQLAFYSLSGMTEKDAKNLLDRAYDVGINTVYTVAKFHDLKSHGTEKVAGQEMNYLLGEYTDPTTNRNAEGFVGSIILNKGAKNILIYSYPDREHAYNQQVTSDLLNSLQGF